MNLVKLKELEEAKRLIEGAMDANCAVLVKNFPFVLSTLSLDDSHREPDIALAKVHSIKRVFSHLLQLSLELQDCQEEEESRESPISLSSEEKERIEAIWNLANTLLARLDLVSMVFDPSLPKFLHYAICDLISTCTRPQYSIFSSLAPAKFDSNTALGLLSSALTSLLEFLLSTPLDPTSSTPKMLYGLSNIISIFSRLFKDSYTTNKSDLFLCTKIASLLGIEGALRSQLEQFLFRLCTHANKAIFDCLALPILETLRRSHKSHFLRSTPFISLPHSCILDFLISQELNDDEEDDGEGRLRDVQVARKIFGILRLAVQARIEAPFFVYALRVVPLLFETTLHSNTKVLSTANTLVRKSYKSNKTKTVEEDAFHPDSTSTQALQRTVALYTLTLVQRSLTLPLNHLSTAIGGHSNIIESIETNLIFLGRILSSRGLFSINPTSPFLQLFSDQDDHLVQALFLLQSILIACHRASQDSLAARVRSKLPQISSVLRVLSPYSLFSTFLASIHYDHSVMLDFLLSPETEHFLRYLLDFVRFCLQDWNRTFMTLFEIKSRRAVPRSDNIVSNDQVDDILELLLQKQLAELHLEGSAISDTTSSALASDAPPPSFLPTTAVDLLLHTNVDTENAFDATMTALIRLLFHLEKASEQRLLDYNIEPLLVRLREIESRYEKLEEEG